MRVAVLQRQDDGLIILPLHIVNNFNFKVVHAEVTRANVVEVVQYSVVDAFAGRTAKVHAAPIKNGCLHGNNFSGLTAGTTNYRLVDG